MRVPPDRWPPRAQKRLSEYVRMVGAGEHVQVTVRGTIAADLLPPGAWAAAVRRAGSTDRMKVMHALESGLSIAGPAGKTTIDPKTHHAVLDVYVAEAQDKKFKVLESFPQQPPADTAAVCDLVKNPGENKQYVIDVKV